MWASLPPLAESADPVGRRNPARVPTPTSRKDTPREPPMGVAVAAVMAATILGGTAAVVLARTAPAIAALMLAVLLACCTGCVRLSRRADTHPRATPGAGGAIAIVALFAGAWLYGIALTFEAISALIAGHLVPGLAGLSMMLAAAVAWLVAPVAIPALISRRRQRAGRPSPGAHRGDPARERAGMKALPDLTPHVIGACFAAVYLVILFVVLLLMVLAVPHGTWQVVALLLFTLGAPVVLWPVGTLGYRTILARWEIDQPAALSDGLVALRQLARFEFARVLCLRARFGNGRSCFVVTDWREPTLVISEQIVNTMPREQLLAVLTHEAAHAVMNHGARKVAWGVLATAASIAVVIALQLAFSRLVPHQFEVLRFVIPPVLLVVPARLYDLYVTRRYEAEADEFATGLVGSAAMLGALETLGGTGPRAPQVHNRWTTHGTWEARASRIEQSQCPTPNAQTREP